MSAILVVCTGNICRSPMAEGLLRRDLADRGVRGITVASCGVSAWEGSLAEPEAVDALAELGMDISTHVARRITPPMVDDAELILGMATEHRDAVARMWPEAADRAFTIKELVHLLDRDGLDTLPPDPRERLRRGVELAAVRRAAGAGEGLLDEDIADPLGLSLHAFQAAAWELEGLSRRLIDRLFGPPAPRPDEWPNGLPEYGRIGERAIKGEPTGAVADAGETM